MQKYQEFIYVGGQPLAGASIKVTTYPGGADATLYAANGSSPTSNPLTADSAGFFSFYAADGRYTITVSKSGYSTRTITDVLLEDPADGSALTVSSLTISGTGRFISGDFDNATIANRVILHTSTVNAGTTFTIAPNGTTTSPSGVIAFQNAALTTGTVFSLTALTTATRLDFGDASGSTTQPLIFRSPVAYGGVNEVARFNPTGECFLGGSVGSNTFSLKANYSATSTRYVTLDGSAAGNPTIGTSAGNISLSNVQVNVASTTATPAGGATGTGLTFGSSTNLGVFFGSGAPTLSAAKGSLYIRTDGSTTNNRMYVNTDGSTTWTAVTTAA